MNTNKSIGQISFCLALMLICLNSCKKESKSPLNFDYVPVQMSKGENWSIIDKDGNEVVKEEYPADAGVSLVRDRVYWVKTNGKCQLFSVDSPKKPLTDEEFAKVTLFNAGVAVVSNPNQLIRIINTKGETVTTLPSSVKKCWAFSNDGYAVFKDTNDKVGILDSKGEIVVHATYSDMIVDIPDGLTLAKENVDDNEWIIINMKGEKQGKIDTEKYHILNKTICDGKIIVRDESNEDGPSIILDKTGKKLFEIRKAREKYGSAIYFDGYLTFMNADNKCGVANDGGEEIIRPKYDALANLGNGEFAAKKGDKWGIINEKDETILDFDYEEGCLRMGNNFLIKDTSGWVLIGKDKKEITSFHTIEVGAVSSYAEFIDVEGFANEIMKFIEECESPQTAAAYAKEHTLSVDDYHYSRNIGIKMEYDNKLTGTLGINYEDYVAEEKSHIEQVNDGWFTNNITVSDGWGWTNALPLNVNGSFELSSNAGVEMKDIYNAVIQKLKEGHKKITDDTFSKNVKMASKNVECRIYFGLVGQNISINISYHQ